MSRRLSPFPVLADSQAAASDPKVHASLSASAGTGKTQVLAARVLRLLLNGSSPSSILCLTFTKAGAAEMANRIGERLAHWVRLPDDALNKELFALGEPRSGAMRQRARRLFAKVLEAPGGGLRIQTIHSFAQTLLASFPAEAGIAPGFRPIEGRAEAELARRTLANLLGDAEAGASRGLLDDVSALSRRLGEQGAEDYLMQCARAHEAMAALGPADAIEERLLDKLGLPEGGRDAAVAVLLADGAFDGAIMERLAAANRQWATTTGNGIADRLTAFLAATSEARAEQLASLGKGIVKTDGDLNQIKPKQWDAEPDYAALAARFSEWLLTIRQIIAAVELVPLQAAGLRAGQSFAAAYAGAKRAMGVADFDDLIRWTRRLFEKPGMGEWVRYKLDQRTDHVLVDEAQDTNEDQWKIVDALAGEFFSGNPETEDRLRTLFMVGDYKQAIFGFQGTSPNEYEHYRALTRDRAAALAEIADENEVRAREFRELSIDASFRSSPAVLNVVDAMIDQLGHRALGIAEPPNPHRAFHVERAGQVELWPPFDAEEAASDTDTGEEGWIDDSTRAYADSIATQVRQWLDQAPVMASTGKPLTPGDILILVRSRKELASLIVARLYRHHVPVAGIDRLHLHKPLAVKDLLAAVTFAVQPLDSLNLANALVSPLIGWDQQTLFDLAYDRDKLPLWTVLQRRRDERPEFGQAHAILADWLAMADYVTPSRFLQTILSGPLDGRRKLIGRLGAAARDPIEELVSSAIAFEQEETPSLDRFVAWFGQGNVEVKRDPSAPSDAVRVMTVHGSKGLEAPLVILADAIHDPAKVGGAQSVIELPLGDAGAVPVVRPRKDEAAPIIRSLLDEQKALDLKEHWRLAYVGLTRARERLVIAGVKPRYSMPAGSWYEAVSDAMQSLGAAAEPHGTGEKLIFRNEGAKKPSVGRTRRALAPLRLPDWVGIPAPPEARPPRPLAPSQLLEDSDSMPPPSPAMQAAARRGNLLHLLFERLPGVVEAERHALALRWLERQGVETDSERREMADAVCNILADPTFADLFGDGSLAEAPIAATLPDGRVIAGTIDRLRISSELVQVIDYKTGRSVPTDAAEVPRSHRLQMEAYQHALAVIFPGSRIEAALLYTSGPKLIALGH